MTRARFFGTFDATSVCVPRLLVGCDQSLDEPHPVIRVRGEDTEGHTLFDHTALSLWNSQWDTLLDLVHGALAAARPGGPVHHNLDMLRLALLRAVNESEDVERLIKQLHLLRDGEKLVLGDEGSTTIVNQRGELIVYRWGFVGATASQEEQGIGQSYDVSQAAAIALGDAHLQYTESVIRQVRLD